MTATIKRRLLAIHRRLLPPDPWIGWTPYLWLIYLGFFYYKFLFVTPGWVELFATLLATGLFLRLYFSGYWCHGGRLWRYVAAIAAIGVIMGPVNPGASVFFIYAGAFAPFLGSGRQTFAAVASLLAVIGLEAWLVQNHPAFWAPSAILTPLIALGNYHFASMARKERALKASQEEVRQLATVAERERIARDLHDLLGHTLSVIALKSELAAKMIGRDGDRAGREIRDVERIARDALSQVREAVTGYRRQGLQGELDSAGLALKAAGIEYRIGESATQAHSQVESVLALVLREAITNVIRHSGAGHCDIDLRPEDGGHRLVVRDDGRGAEAYRGGSGMQGMRERVEVLGGRLSVASDRGTVVEVWVPGEPAGSDRWSRSDSAA